MGKKYYRYFGGLLTAQEHWLNKMAFRGYRLIRSEKLLYEFEPCKPGQYQYCVDFIGQKSKAKAADYYSFLENMGYHVFYKNINLNYSVGKVRFRPWAEKGGRIATNATTFNRELLIVEKANDAKAFELHTSFADRAEYYGILRKPWLCLFVVFGGLGIIRASLAWGIFALIALIPVILYQVQIFNIKKEAGIKEW